MPPRFRRAFTLIELLVVIAIIAILAVVVVLTLNPAQLLAQSRDANRVSDMATLNSAVSLYETDQSGSVGTSSIAYISLPSPSSTCATLGIATSAYAYACSSSSNYRNTNGTGWMPINFQNISSGAPFGSLPVDPVNQTSSNLYYAYEAAGTQYTLSAFMESQKYASTMATTGSVDPGLYTIGSGISVLPDASRGLVGFWPLNEGTGTVVYDMSGYNATGSWQGSLAGTSGHYSSPGKNQSYAAYFNGTNNYIPITSLSPLSNLSAFTLSAWVNETASATEMLFNEGTDSGHDITIFICGGDLCAQVDNPSDGTAVSPPLNLPAPPAYAQIVVVYNGNQTGNANRLQVYLNDVPQTLTFGSYTVPATTANLTGYENISTYGNGGFNSGWDGSISDLRIYDRALSPTEIQELYNAGG
ncbi:MAG TPA: LamG-like jellyroll fold domain-containing protein [Candidatus Paceibacterota bacterium]|nr:LamG-like jellyroll fold domain-containing protein [Candidatus Paceibacterota bacterium]